MTFVASAVVLGAVGYWVDGLLGTKPFILILGILLGFVGGFIHLLARVAPDLLPFGRDRSPPSDDDHDPDR